MRRQELYRPKPMPHKGVSYLQKGVTTVFFGFNPLLVPVNRRALTVQLRQAIHTARQFGFQVIELTCTESMFDLGLSTIFGGEFTEELMKASDLRIHFHLFYGHHSLEEVALTDTHAPTRAIYLRRLLDVVDFFERRSPVQLYIVHTGPRVYPLAEHLDALAKALEALRTIYPHVQIAVENGRRGSVIEGPDEILALLKFHPEIPFVFDTSLAYQAVGFHRFAYGELLKAVGAFDHQIVEIHWNNTAPGFQPNRPLHVPLEGGIDLDLAARRLRKNPHVTHLIETLAARDTEALVRDQRLLYRALLAA